ncbi:MAG TPA: hypothetical protein DCY42_02040 [Chloroflexi bacterium]|nr:hypothetical protein [Chloroflexota bacterium]
MRAVFYSYHLDEAAVLQVVLQRAGFATQQVQDLAKFIDIWAERPADFVLVAFGGFQPLDVHVVESLRSQTMVPIFIIDDFFSEEQHVTLLEAGADLMITRPYSSRILISQIRATMRRSVGMPFFSLPILSQSGVMIDPSTRTIQVQDQQVARLTQLEFRLLFTLMTHAGRVIPTETLVEYVWGFSGEGNRGLVRGLVQRLRAKVEPNPASPRYIMTEPGLGYRFNPYQELD